MRGIKSNKKTKNSGCCLNSKNEIFFYKILFQNKFIFGCDKQGLKKKITQYSIPCFYVEFAR